MPEIRDISLSQIDEPELALRADMDDAALDELAADIRDNGMLYPLIVHAKGERYEVRDGHRRLLCCRRLNQLSVRCIVHTEADPPPEAVKLKSNLLRESNTDAEIAVWLGELAQVHKYSLQQLCTATGRSESWVNERVALLNGYPEVLQALGERKINFSQARALNRCKHDATRAAGLEFAVHDNIPARKLQEWLERNDDASGVPEGASLPPQPVAQNGNASEPGIVCAFCGGHKDPYNMEQIWLHRWELDIVRKVLAGGAA